MRRLRDSDPDGMGIGLAAAFPPGLVIRCSPWLPTHKNLTASVAYPPHEVDWTIRHRVDVAFSGEFRRLMLNFAERFRKIAAKLAIWPQIGHWSAMIGVALRKLFATKVSTQSRSGDF